MPTSRDTVSLPILPITAVLFPGMPLTVPVSEEPFGQMIQECVEQDTSLVVSLARSGNAGEWPEPMAIGTSARVLEATRGSDQITVMGIARVNLLSYRHNGRFLIGQFRYLADSDDTVPAPLVDEARALGSELWALLTPHQSHPVLPAAASGLSYWIAAHIPLAVTVQQELLEIRSTRARMAKEISIMRSLLDDMRAEQHN